MVKILLLPDSCFQPKEITDIKKFLNIAKPEEKAAAGGAKKPVTKKGESFRVNMFIDNVQS